MPRQNTSPADFPPAILAQIEELAQGIVAQRKQRSETQAQWAARLGISQPTMARIERGDPSVAMATYVSCLWQLNPALDLTRLLAPAATQARTPALAPACRAEAPSLDRKRNGVPKKAKPAAEPVINIVNHDEQQAQIERNFAAAKAALDFFKSPLF
ncbi:helix-turn-helix domain-containing protein [Comamonas testosteroni]|uniref:helix-turn-helix domain-containing protein n=1 Tax=Comamonas testosteroni TaxID=285 RepID=UPI0005B4490E|nr:helix-turn-helix domain-containing protein [Comamonas testosteroni]